MHHSRVTATDCGSRVDVDELHYACLHVSSILFYFLIYLFILSHNPPRLSPPRTPLQHRTCPINLAVYELLYLAAKHHAHASHAQIALRVRESDTAQIPNDLLRGRGQVFLRPKTPMFLRFPVRFNELPTGS